MPTRWETFPIELTGGLVTNMSRLQQGIKAPGSARLLQNFEPSVKGGYRRINGYEKYDTTAVPYLGDPLVQASGQTGTTLNIANIFEEPSAGDTFTIAGVTGTYTIDTGGVSYSAANKSATLTLTSSLASSPADQAAVSFTNTNSLITGLFFFVTTSKTYVLRNGVCWRGEGSGWTKVSTPSYGTVLVDTGSQTGSSLIVDGISSDTYVPQQGDTFTVAGIEKVYTVTADASVTSGSATLSIAPALASSPADDAALTFLNSDLAGGTKARFEQFNFNGTEKFVCVDGVNRPFVVDENNNFSTLQGSADIVGAAHVKEFANHLFFATDDVVTFCVPFDETDFATGSGAGAFRMPSTITGLAVFRTQLIAFAEMTIKKLTGTAAASFVLDTIAANMGCVHPDTIMEVGGDILFLAADGIRFLGATERIGDFNLSLASKAAQDAVTSFVIPTGEYCSIVIREKSQYRIFRYTPTELSTLSEGFIGTQFLDQNGQSFDWGQLIGIQAYRAYSAYTGETETVIFSNVDGFVYRMESGADFAGTAITSRFYTPFISVSDPELRKTGYKLSVFFDPEGTFAGNVTLKYDFNNPAKVQPNLISISGGGSFSYYGTAVYGTDTYGGWAATELEKQIIGSFFNVSFQFEFDGTGQPFVLDTMMLEYSTEDRK